MYRFYPLIVLLAFTFSLPAQTYFQREKRDYVWLLGYASSAQVPGFGGTRIDFNTTPPTVAYEYRDMNFEAANASICDADGNLLFYTNGIYVANYLHEPMENGEGLNPTNFTEEWAESGIPYPQVIIALPQTEAKYMLIHSSIEQLEEPDQYGEIFLTYNLLYTTIDMSENEGRGKVISKNNVLIADTIDRIKLTAVRHANGRDWWVVVADYFSNGFYRVLVKPDTILNYGLQAIGDTIPSGLGQAAFSPDGTKYARLNLYHLGQDQYIDIYDFDRCTGTFSNPVQFTYRDTAIVGGLAFSENSRFLNISSTRFTYQFDLEAENIPSSKVVVGSMLDFPDAITCFFLSQLAPNGEIIIGTCGTQDSLHVIRNPNKKGKASNLEFNGLVLPTRDFRTIPNFPYYGLGPMDGSACDTLGIDNPPPTAAFEYTADTTALTVAFFDGSFFADEWYWDFGDGTTSTTRHPEHSFAQAGPHEVCLTVSNVSGSDTHCEVLMLGTVAAQEPAATPIQAKAYPNPAQNTLQVDLSNAAPLTITLLDMYGRTLLVQEAKEAPTGQTLTFDTSILNSGLYLLELSGLYTTRQIVRVVIMK